MNWFTRRVCGRGIGLGCLGCLFVSLLQPASLLAQASNAAAISGGPIVTPYGTIAAGAPIRVCLITSIGTPCSTAGVSLYSDANLTQPLPNPTALTSQGLYGFFTTSPGYYIIQVQATPAAIYTYYYFAVAGGGSSPGGSTYATQYNAGSGNFGGAGPGTSGQVLTSNGSGSPPSFQAATGGIGGSGTPGFFSCFLTSTSIDNCPADYNVTNAEDVTISKDTVINDPTCVGCASWISFIEGTAPSFTSGRGYVFGDASGNMMSNDNATGSGRICNAVNGVCPGFANPMTTAGDLIYGGASGSPTRLAANSSGTQGCLTSVSSGNPTWTVPCPGGGGSYPTPVTVTGIGVAELDLTGCITSSQRDYDIRFSNILFASGSGVTTDIQFSSNNGSSWDTTTAYNYARNYQQMIGGSNANTSTSQNSGGIVPTLISTDTNNSGDILDIRLNLYYPMNTTAIKMGGVKTQLYFTSGPNAYNIEGSFYYTGSSAVNAVRLVTTGTFTGQATCQPLPQ